MVLVTMVMLVWDITGMLVLVIMDTLDSAITDTLVSDILDILPTMESVMPRQSPRLRLTQPCFTAPMILVLDTMDMLDLVITGMLVWDIMAMLVLDTMDM